ncbi:DUF4270 family protein [Mongoliitalea daihaiensis]|nr:DUF4270 family protein [Mongoliitalea daihaiensis]
MKAITGLFLLSIIAASCSDPSSIGLDLDPNTNQIGVNYQEVSLSAKVVRLDSVSTTNNGHLVFGHDSGDFFGESEGVGYSRLFFDRDINFPSANAVLDSVRFNFNVRFVLADQLTSPKTIRVHKLKEQIQDRIYYSFDGLEYEEEPIVSASFNFQNNQDTLVNIKVDNEFVRNLFEEIKSGQNFTDIFTFRNFLPGLAFTGDKSEQAAFTIRPGSSTGMIFFYRNEGDTISRIYPVATGLNFNVARHFSQYKVNSAGSATESVTQSHVAYDVGNRVGMKGMSNIVVKLETEALARFLDTLDNVTFNRVILEMGPMEENRPTHRPFDRNIMYFTNETNRILRRSDGRQLFVSPDNRPQFDPETGEPASDVPSLLFHDRETNLLNQSLTAHVNAIYRRRIQRRDLLLYPGQTGSDDFTFSMKENVWDKNTIKLKIFYSRTRVL